MIPLNGQQKQLLFDYSMGLTSQQDSAEAERLLDTHEEALRIHQALRNTLTPLDTYEVEPCPDFLADVTLSRLKMAAQAEPASEKLESLLAAEETSRPTVRIPLWRNWGDVAAVAAVIVLLVGVVLPALGLARQKYWQMRCQNNLEDVHEGFASYVAEHDGKLPNSALEPGSLWWKVGYQGDENVSNTRGAWRMVKDGYVRPDAFTCPGRRESRRHIDAAKIQNYNDFPYRSSMHFSMRVPCPQFDQVAMTHRTEILADRNPIAEEFPSDYSRQFVGLRLRSDHLTANSRNHSGRGQNVLFSDGSVVFVRQRHTKSSNDDFYILDGMSNGSEVRGCEVPSCMKDALLAP